MRLKMDQEKILIKFDELEQYLEELEKIKPNDFENYSGLIKDKRACERLLQISIETVLDICNILISGLRLGIPSEEEDVFEKLEKNNIISKKMKKILIGMKGTRNFLVHKYGVVDDEKIFEVLSDKLADFDTFKEEIIDFIK